jgi:hypothetical protein
MGESGNKLRSEIDVSEFERRLRAPAPSASYEDPLAELARLVDGKSLPGDDPFRELFAQPRQAPARRAAPLALGREHAFFADLRGSLDAHQGTELPADVIPSHAPPVPAAEPAMAEGEPAAWAGQDPAYAEEPQPRTMRSRRPLYAMGAIVCAGLVGIGASFAMRSKVPGAQELALVKAPAGPVKVQPQNPGGVDVPNQSASVLDRSAGSSVTKVVSREEQPVDLDQQVKQMRVITLGGPKDGSVSAVNTQRAAAVPVPPPPAASVSTTNNGFPEPKRVKTVSVRPDGSLLTADASPSLAISEPAPTPAARPAPSATAAETSSLPKSSTPKSTVRVAATTPRVDPPTAAAAPVAGDHPVATASPPAKPKVAAPKPKPEPVRVASAEDNSAANAASPPAASSGGGFAVQLSAPGSEKEARSISDRLGQKFAAVLDGHQPSVVKAEIGEKSIYRVRVGSLSREEANTLCGKIKAKGGDCFVAKN